MKLSSKWISPDLLMIFTWGITLILAFLTPDTVLKQHNITKMFNIKGLLWIFLSVLVFCIGVWIIKFKLIKIEKHINHKKIYYIDSSTKTFYYFSLFIFILIIIWTLNVANEIGGIQVFISQIHTNWHRVRRLWPNRKPFVGARLLYTGLVASAIYFSTSFALLKDFSIYTNNFKKTKKYIIRGFLFSYIILLLLPIIISQRLLFATALAGSITAYLIYKNKIDLNYIIKGVFISLGLWTAQESVRVNFVSGNIVDNIIHSYERLSFYFANNVANVTNGVANVRLRSYGFLTFNALFEFLYLDSPINNNYLLNFRKFSSPYKGGGTWTGLGVPFMDFGWFGILIIFIWGVLSSIIYYKAKNSFFWAQIYGMIAASILLSFHVFLFGSASFWFSIFLLIIVNSLVRFKKVFN